MEISDVDGRWRRIATDIATATATAQHLAPRLSPGEVDSAWGQWWEVETILDGERAGPFGAHFPSEREASVVALADVLQGHFSDNIWGGWPSCPDHKTHPLEPVLDEESIAVWKCPIGRIVAEIGELAPRS